VHYRLAEPADSVGRSLLACVSSCFTGIASLDTERQAATARAAERRRTPCA
jgi:hypothetical protein